MTGTHSCFFSSARAIALLPMTGAAMGARVRLVKAMIRIADASAVCEHLDLKNAVHIGHSTGGGEVARYVAQYGQPQGRVAKAVK